MTIEKWLLILGGVGTFIGVVAAAWRSLTGDRFTRKVTESAALLTGYTEMVKNLRVEIKEIREDHDHEVQRNRKQCTEDQERLQRLHKQELDSLIAVYSEERHNWDRERERLMARLEALEAQVTTMLARPQDTRERKND